MQKPFHGAPFLAARAVAPQFARFAVFITTMTVLSLAIFLVAVTGRTATGGPPQKSSAQCDLNELENLAELAQRRKPFEPRAVASSERLSIDPKSLKPIDIRLPDSMRLMTARTTDGKTIQVLERTVKTADGVQQELTEMPIDPVTGVLDGSLETAREFASLLAQTNDGKWAAHVVDVNNLGYINKNFLFGLEPTQPNTAANIRMVTDFYLGSIAKALQEQVGPNGIVIRTGGDEFLVLQKFDERFVTRATADTKKAESTASPSSAGERVDVVVDLQQRLQAAVSDRNGVPKQLLLDEAKARAEQARKRRAQGEPLTEDEKRAYRLDYAPHSQPSVSIGTSIVNGEDLFGEAVPAADRLMTAHKDLLKSRDNAPTSPKRPAVKQDPDGSARFANPKSPINQVRPANPLPPREEAPSEPTALAQRYRDEAVSAAPLPPRAQARKLPETVHTRLGEVSRFGRFSVVQYRDSKNQLRYFAEEYRNGSLSASRELPKDAVTGIVSARQPIAQKLLKEFIESSSTRERSLIWVNVEHLGLINSFNALKAEGGDLILKAFAEIIGQVAPEHTYTLKRGGSEFVLAIEGIPTNRLKEIETELAKRFQDSNTVRMLWSQQLRYLQEQFVRAQAEGQTVQANQLRVSIEELREKQKNLVTIHGTEIRTNDDPSSVRSRTRAIRYPDDSSYSVDGL